MKKTMKLFASLALSLFVCVGAVAVGTSASPSVSVDAVTSTAGNYYDGITATNGTALLGQLHDLIVSTHSYYSSYDDCKDYAKQTDPSGSGILEFYTHEEYPNNFGSSVGILNREHVWPKSLGHWENSNAGADMHHIRPTEYTTNNKRGNDKYGEVSGGTAVHSSKGGLAGYYSSSGVFEPNDFVKGDAARIVMYVYTHYNTASRVYGTKESKGSGPLDFNDIMAPSSESAAIELLLEWNKLDPVDDIERTRNEAVYEIQGNRNPFIDNPEYANAIWGDGTVVGGGGSQGGGDDGGSTTPTETFTPITEPQEGTYYLGMNAGGTYYYAKSSLVKDYYIETTTDISSAAQYTLSKQGDGWVIKTGSSFLEIAFVIGTDNKTHPNPKFYSSQTSGKTWTWDAQHAVFTWTDGTDSAFLGNYGNNTSIAGAFSSYLDQDYLAQLGTYGTSGGTQGGGTQGGGTQGGGTQGGGSQGGDVDVSGGLQGFHTAVGELVTEGSLAERFASIKRAIAEYQTLTSVEKTQCTADLELLNAAIAAYNELVSRYNAANGKSAGGALGSLGELLG